MMIGAVLPMENSRTFPGIDCRWQPRFLVWVILGSLATIPNEPVYVEGVGQLPRFQKNEIPRSFRALHEYAIHLTKRLLTRDLQL
jgi:hypothetical protein